MGLLDSILGAALGGGQQQAAPSGNAALLNMVLGMLANGGGGQAAGGATGGLAGLGQLVTQFQRSGLGDVVGSWVSTGQNQPIQPDQLGQVLGLQQQRGRKAEHGLHTRSFDARAAVR